MGPKVIVTINPKGKVEVEVDGAKGEGCEALTEAFEARMGTVKDKTFKPERWVRDDAAMAQG